MSDTYVMKSFSRVYVDQGGIGSGDAPFSAIMIIILAGRDDFVGCALTVGFAISVIQLVPFLEFFRLPSNFHSLLPKKEVIHELIVLCHTACQELRRRSRTWEVRKFEAKLTPITPNVFL